MDERELLKSYVETGNQEAFAEVVNNHGSWLVSAARRQLGDEHLAEDVTQAVFVLLLKRAGRLRRYNYVGGWLFLALSYCVKRAKRERARLARREKEAASMRKEAMEEAKWEDVAPELDAAVGKLGKVDRDAILLRFYERRPLAEVGKALGISEEAARMRVQRAVGSLREKLGKKGITGTTAGLSAVLVGNVVGQMPEGLAEKIVSAVGSGGGNTVAAAIAKGAEKMMVWAKVKVAAVAVGGLFLAAGVAAALVRQLRPSSTVQRPQRRPPPNQARRLWCFRAEVPWKLSALRLTRRAINHGGIQVARRCRLRHAIRWAGRSILSRFTTAIVSSSSR